MKYRLDLHNHTKRCNHADGSLASFVKEAIKLGVNYYAFSCHAPMEFDYKFRMGFNQLQDYFNDIDSIKDEFKDKITILKALEVDYILDREDLLDLRVLNSKADFLIGSVHFLNLKDNIWGFDNPEFLDLWAKKDVRSTWSLYLKSVRSMCETRAFQIVGHFDLPKLFGHKMPSCLKDELLSTLESIKKADMILEINQAGLRKGVKEQYPSLEILKLAKKLDIDITFSSDAHRVADIGYGYEQCLKMAKDVGYSKACIFKNKQKIMLDI